MTYYIKNPTGPLSLNLEPFPHLPHPRSVRRAFSRLRSNLIKSPTINLDNLIRDARITEERMSQC
jgi:hypothetical protein